MHLLLSISPFSVCNFTSFVLPISLLLPRIIFHSSTVLFAITSDRLHSPSKLRNKQTLRELSRKYLEINYKAIFPGFLWGLLWYPNIKKWTPWTLKFCQHFEPPLYHKNTRDICILMGPDWPSLIPKSIFRGLESQWHWRQLFSSSSWHFPAVAWSQQSIPSVPQFFICPIINNKINMLDEISYFILLECSGCPHKPKMYQ